MSKLIVCLGYHLEPDNSVPSVLKNRLLDAVNLCKNNNNSILLLMGSSPYWDLGKDKISEALAMKKYLAENFSEELGGIKIITEETTVSTVGQLCYLKEFIVREKLNLSDLVIVSSEFFSDRVKLYAEYVLGSIDGIIFIDSSVPAEIKEKFQKAEKYKLSEGIKWLNIYKKGDDQTILRAQREFQNKVMEGKIKQPPSS